MTDRAAHRGRGAVPFAAAGAAVLILAGCAPAEESAATFDELCTSPVVARCQVDTATVSPDASPDEVVALALDLRTAAAEAGDGSISLRGESSVPWSIDVSSGDREAMAGALRGMLATTAVPGLVSMSVIDGWPYVSVADIDSADAVFDALSAAEPFSGGATYAVLEGEDRLRVVHVPSRTSDAAVHEIIDISRRLPEAEVLLEATTYVPQVPTLYVSRLSPEEAAQLAAELSDPRWVEADVDGYPLEFVLGARDADGTAYTTGTFGGVPS